MATLPINLGINGNWILYQKTTSKIETKKSVSISIFLLNQDGFFY